MIASLIQLIPTVAGEYNVSITWHWFGYCWPVPFATIILHLLCALSHEPTYYLMHISINSLSESFRSLRRYI